MKKARILIVLFGLLLTFLSVAMASESFTEEEYRNLYQREYSEEEQKLLNEKKEIIKVDVLHNLVNNTFMTNEKMSLVGLKIKVTYDDHMEEIIDFKDERLVCDDFNSGITGVQSVDFYLIRNNQKDRLGCLLVNVVENEENKKNVDFRNVELKGSSNEGKLKLWYAEITQMPTKSTYLLGDRNIDFTGLKFKYVLSDGSYTEEISYDTEHFDFIDSSATYFDYSLIGTQDARLQWRFTEQYGDRYYSTAYGGTYEVIYVPITIKENLDDRLITEAYIKDFPSKTVFALNEEVVVNDGSAMVVYEDGEVAVIPLNETTILKLIYQRGREGNTGLRIVFKEGSFVDIGIRFIDYSKQLNHDNALAKNSILRIDENNYRSEEVEALYRFKSGDLPSKYSLEETIDIEVANQGVLGLCNLFAPTKSSETNTALLKGKVFDFSERHADYMMSTQIAGNRTAGSLSNHVEGDAFANEDAIHHAMVIGYAEENEIPYQDYSDMNVIKNANIVARASKYVLFNFVYETHPITMDIDFDSYMSAREKTIEMVKRHIMQYGSVKVAVGSTAWGKNWYNNPGFSAHAISIIGWDDNYSKDNFTGADGEKPARDGCFIVLNSWGSNWGDNGKLYLSYWDERTWDFTGVLDTETLDGKVEYQTSCDEAFFKNEKHLNIQNKAFFYIPFDVDSENNYLKAINIPTKGGDYDRRVYLVNNYNNSNINNYEYLGTIKDCGLYSDRLVLNEPIKLNGSKYVIIVESEPNETIYMFQESNINTYYSVDTLKNKSAWQKYSYEFPLYVETTNLAKMQESVVDEVSINTLPTKLRYKPGEELDLTGGKINIHYTDGTTVVKNMTDDGVSHCGYTSYNSMMGTIEITVFYEEKSVTFSIAVVDISSISIKKMPTSLQYKDNSSTHLCADGTLEATYSNGETSEVAISNELVHVYIDGIYKGTAMQWFYWDKYSLGTHTVTFEYLEKTTELEIEVVSSAQSINYISGQTKTQYYDGEPFDMSGAVLEITFSDGSKKNYTTFREMENEFGTCFINWDRMYDGKLHKGDTYIIFENLETVFIEGVDATEDMFTFTVVDAPGPKGDINGDESLNIIDVKLLLQYIIKGDGTRSGLTDEQMYFYDINYDGMINIIDVKLLLQQVINGSH